MKTTSRKVKELINNFKWYLDCVVEATSDIETTLDSITVVDNDTHYEYRLKSVTFDGEQTKFCLESVRTIVGTFGKREHLYEYVDVNDFDEKYMLYEEWKKTQFPRTVAHMAHDINDDLKEIIEAEIIAGHTVGTTFWDTELVWVFDASPCRLTMLRIKIIRSTLPAVEIYYNGAHYFTCIKAEDGDVTTSAYDINMTNDALSPLTVEVFMNIADTIRKFLKEMES